jgi:putative NADH-flavin reductase
MNVAIIGATGNVGRRILQEALSRGHEVTACVRNPSSLPFSHERLRAISFDILNADDAAAKLAGFDSVVSAYGPGFTNVRQLVDATSSLITGSKRAAVQHLVAVGGAGSLEVAPGVALLTVLPEEWKGIAQAHADSLALYKAETELRWSYCSPAAYIEPGERTGTFRTGSNALLTDSEGNSRISMEDYAIAILDEVEQKAHVHQQFCVAY